MTDIQFSTLIASLQKRPRSLSVGPRLAIPTVPDPFVAPTLRLAQPDNENALNAEVIFIKASAAVGKSTIANFLSGTLGIPLLNLAKIPVSTGSLKALLLDISGARDPFTAFHSGKLPIVIDALDEGRLLSGEQGFESFLETAGELLKENRTVTDRPKLIFLGRYDSTELAEIWVSLTGNRITTCTLEVAFFDEKSALALINAYAEASAGPRSAYRHHPAPVRKLVEAYFVAIEAALGLPRGQLWLVDQGKAFAGYAPVLSAMGSLLAQLDNFQDVTNKLEKTEGVREAWDVIDTVLMEITNREKLKLCEKAAVQISTNLPPEAYDTDEQLTLLLQFVHGQPLQGSGKVKLIGGDRAKYQAMVKAYIPEHPFIRNNDFGNAVLGSVVIAHGILHDLLGSADLERTSNYSRQPFLWRATSQKLGRQVNISGKYIGFILNSFWNDPIQLNRRVSINSLNDSEASVTVFQNRSRFLSFTTNTPIHFYAQIKDCECDLAGDLRFFGDGPPSSTAFYVRGSSSAICSNLDVQSATIRFEGESWLEAENVNSPPLLRIYVANDAKLGWGGSLGTKHPWSEFTSTQPPPYEPMPEDKLGSLVGTLANRTLPGATMVLNDDFSPIFDDRHMRWANRQYAREFPQLIKLLIAHKLAETEPLGMSDQGKKVRVRPDLAWWDLFFALENSKGYPSWESFISDARHAINR